MNRKETVKYPIWDQLQKALSHAIHQLGAKVKITQDEWCCSYELKNCHLHFLYQKHENFIDVVIAKPSNEFGSENRVQIIPALELFLTGELHIYSINFGKGPEKIVLLNNEIQNFGYIARMLESPVLKEFVENGLVGIDEFNDWLKVNSTEIFTKMKSARNDEQLD